MALTPDDLRKAASLLEDADGIAEQIAKKQSEFEASIAELRNREAELRSEAARLVGSIASSGKRAATKAASRAKTSADDVVAILKGSPDLNGTQIAERLGVVPATANRLLKELVSAGSVTAEGERRGRKYRAA